MCLFDKLHKPIYQRLISQMPSILHLVSKSDCKSPLGQKKAHYKHCSPTHLLKLLSEAANYMFHSLIPRIKYISQSLYH